MTPHAILFLHVLLFYYLNNHLSQIIIILMNNKLLPITEYLPLSLIKLSVIFIFDTPYLFAYILPKSPTCLSLSFLPP